MGEKVSRNSYSGRRIHHKPPCVTQGAGDRPGGIAPPKNPLAKFAQQELPYPQGPLAPGGLPNAAALQDMNPAGCCTAPDIILQLHRSIVSSLPDHQPTLCCIRSDLGTVTVTMTVADCQTHAGYNDGYSDRCGGCRGSFPVSHAVLALFLSVSTKMLARLPASLSLGSQCSASAAMSPSMVDVMMTMRVVEELYALLRRLLLEGGSLKGP